MFSFILKYILPVLLLSLLTYLIFTESPIDPAVFEIPPFPGLPANESTLHVQTVESLHLNGPESVTVDTSTGMMYTGLKNGLIVKFDANLQNLEVILRIVDISYDHMKNIFGINRALEDDRLSGKNICKRIRIRIYWNCKLKAVMKTAQHRGFLVTQGGGPAPIDDEECNNITAIPLVKCGRPLGIRIYNSIFLYVIDTFKGLFVIELNSKSKSLLIDINKPSLYGLTLPIMFMDDLTLNSDASKIYFTDASYENSLYRFFHEAIEFKPRGRVFSFDLKDNKLSMILDNLYFANGIELDYSGNALLITESNAYRVIRYFIDNATTEIYADNLIGMPDNIRKAESGGYWIGMGALRTWPYISDIMARHPIISKSLLKLVSSEFIMANLAEKTGQAIRLDENGKLVEFLFDDSAEYINSVSEVLEYNRALYVCSFAHPYMVKIARDN